MENKTERYKLALTPLDRAMLKELTLDKELTSSAEYLRLIIHKNYDRLEKRRERLS